ncbi:Hypothetical protein R9X50_00044700 [Acrodontium crateriforme]|uniref:Apple domain-containing protein n=1 Tax=Acrodontium crateriforme TaxID=150365 RepID=A0AAQ3M0B1_9PEZI|nr:Hypothetical protein R9X50_00044700 [Acrodontium crateriforme]
MLEAKAERTSAPLDDDGQTCPSGTTYYYCANGFLGCCSVDPCNSEQTCPDSKSTTPSIDSVVTSSTDQSITTTATITSTIPGQTVTKTLTIGQMSTTSPSGSSISSSIAAPSCPTGNNTIYTDDSFIKYTILCNQDNTYPDLGTMVVVTDGYSQCFSACSTTGECVGFVFIGTSNGTCYLKAQFPNDTIVHTTGSNHIAATKFNVTAPVFPPDSVVPIDKKLFSPGTLAGIVIGCLAILALNLYCCAKRRRSNIESKKTTVITPIHVPLEMHSAAFSGGRLVLTGSTSNVVFVPYGGFHRGFSEIQIERTKPPELKDKIPVHPGLRAERGASLHPVAARRRPKSHSADDIAMVNRPGTPIRQNVEEMENVSIPAVPVYPTNTRPSSAYSDSPTLGRRTSSAALKRFRRTKSLISWNNHGAEHVDEEDSHERLNGILNVKIPPIQVSRDATDGVVGIKYVVSPLGSVERKLTWKQSAPNPM